MSIALDLVIGAILVLLLTVAWLATHQEEDAVTIPDDWED